MIKKKKERLKKKEKEIFNPYKRELIRKYCNFNYWEEKYQLFIC